MECGQWLPTELVYLHCVFPLLEAAHYNKANLPNKTPNPSSLLQLLLNTPEPHLAQQPQGELRDLPTPTSPHSMHKACPIFNRASAP